MSFQPLVPLSGYTGWTFLQRTLDAQQTAFKESAPVQRATDYFRENIKTITTAEDLVKDRQLLQVALGAFGLDDDIDNKFFIQKILEDGTFEDDALANRLADNRYAEFAAAFGFGDFSVPLSTISTVADTIVTRFEAKQFEQAVGDQNNDLRLALNFGAALSEIVGGTQNETAQWFSIMGNQPLRQVVQTALGLPAQIATIDLDQQLTAFRDRAVSVFGTDKVADLTAANIQEDIVRLFLVRSDINGPSANTPGSVALTLLQGAG